jgi:hypothetical protein
MVRGVKKALTAEAFGKFLRWLSPNDESAVQEYQSIRLRLVRYFVHKGCSDPDDLFDKTIDVVVGKIEGGGEYPNPAAFCFGVARISGVRIYGSAVQRRRRGWNRIWHSQPGRNYQFLSRN